MRPVAVGACVAAFVLYLVGVRFAVALLRLGGRKPGPSLLLLRVFGFQQRTERLFDTVAARWRFEGAVAMIAGGDLALRSIDAGEALAFARGDIASGYVGDVRQAGGAPARARRARPIRTAGIASPSSSATRTRGAPRCRRWWHAAASC